MSKSLKSDPFANVIVRTRTLGRCQCGATKFQGPNSIGEVVDQVFVVRENVFRCVNCNTVQTIEQMTHFETPAPEPNA